MNDTDRERFAAKLRRLQTSRFHSQAKAAYTAAGVNPETWRRATAGLSVKPHTISTIVSNLWPEAGGDWQAVPDDVRPVGSMESRFSQSVLQDLSDEELLEELGRRLGRVAEIPSRAGRMDVERGIRLADDEHRATAEAERVADEAAAREGRSRTRAAAERQDAEATAPDDLGEEAGA